MVSAAPLISGISLSEHNFSRPQPSHSPAITQVLPRDLRSFAIALHEALSYTEEMKRLHSIWQAFGVRCTTLAHDQEIGSIVRYFNHSRFDHSRGVGVKVWNWGSRIGFSEDELKVAAAVGDLHDIAVCGFCHVGERMLRAYGFEDFDHDLHALIVASQPSIQGVLTCQGLNGKDVVAALGAEIFPTAEDKKEEFENNLAQFQRMAKRLKRLGLPFDCILEMDESKPEYEDTLLRLKRWESVSHWVQHYCDILDYLVRDTEMSPQNVTSVDEMRRYVAEAQNAFCVTGNGELALSDIEPVIRVVQALKTKEKHTALSVATSWANERLLYALRHSGVTEKEIITGVDTELLNQIADEERALLNDGIDSHFSEGFRIVPRQDAQTLLSPGILQQLLRGKIAALGSGPAGSGLPAVAAHTFGHPDVIVSVTPPFRKEFSFKLVDDAVSQLRSYHSLETLLESGGGQKRVDEPLAARLVREKGNPNNVTFSLQGSQQISVAIRNGVSPRFGQAVDDLVQSTVESREFGHSYELRTI